MSGTKHSKRLRRMINQAARGSVKLNLGSGQDYKEGWVNCDNHPGVKKDKFVDLEKKLPFKDNYADTIVMNNVFEHIHKPLALLQEIHRVLKKGGIAIIIVPHFTNCNYYADLTHVRPGSYQMFKNIETDHFYQGFDFRVRKVKLLFSKNWLLWDYVMEPIANMFPTLYEYTPLRVFQCWDVWAELVKK